MVALIIILVLLLCLIIGSINAAAKKKKTALAILLNLLESEEDENIKAYIAKVEKGDVKTKEAIEKLVSMAGDKIQPSIHQLLNECKSHKAEIKDGPLAEYYAKKKEIERIANGEIQRIKSHYSAQKQAISQDCNARAAHARQCGDTSTANYYVQRKNSELNALTRMCSAEVKPLEDEKRSALKNLQAQYQDVIDAYQGAKNDTKVVKYLADLIKKNKKQQQNLKGLVNPSLFCLSFYFLFFISNSMISKNSLFVFVFVSKSKICSMPSPLSCFDKVLRIAHIFASSRWS